MLHVNKGIISRSLTHTHQCQQLSSSRPRDRCKICNDDILLCARQRDGVKEAGLNGGERGPDLFCSSLPLITLSTVTVAHQCPIHVLLSGYAASKEGHFSSIEDNMEYV